MRHVEISVDAIHPNPHRDFKRNPVRSDQVERLVESIGRTGFWDNVVVRPHPDRKGEYQLAYGHTRLAAVKKCNLDTVRLPVADLSDWDMYVAMVDENETQKQITPAIAFENVETGLELLEKAFKQIGPEGTAEEFNESLGSRVVPTGTTRDSRGRDNGGSGFEQVRNRFFAGDGIGRVFVTEVLPSGKMRPAIVSEVLNTHYGKQRETAKQKQAEAKSKEASAKAARARAEKDEAEAARLRAEARAAAEEAARLKAEAEKIGGGFVDASILLQFDKPNQMTDFASAIKAAGVPKEHHAAAAAHVRSEEAYGKKMAPAVDLWWYTASGQSARDRKKREKEETFKRFRKKVKDGDLKQFFLDIGQKVRGFAADLKFAGESALLLDHEKLRAGLCRDLEELIEQARVMIRNLSDPVDDPDVIDAEVVDPSTNGHGRALPASGTGSRALN